MVCFHICSSQAIQKSSQLLNLRILYRYSFLKFQNFLTDSYTRTGYITVSTYFHRHTCIYNGFAITNSRSYAKLQVLIRSVKSPQCSGVAVMIVAITSSKVPFCIRIEIQRMQGGKCSRSGHRFVNLFIEASYIPPHIRYILLDISNVTLNIGYILFNIGHITLYIVNVCRVICNLIRYIIR